MTACTRKRKPLPQRFWIKVDKNGPVIYPWLENCWTWRPACKRSDYGRIVVIDDAGKHRLDLAHRVSWRLTNGTIPDATFVLHKCDNKTCVNPEHLELGTNEKNIKDAVDRGLKAHGLMHPAAALNKDEVLAIHQLRDMGWTHTKIASEIGINRQMVQSVLSGRRYRDLNLPVQKGKRFVAHKLTQDDVIRIRSYSRDFSNARLAKMFGIASSGIHYIRTGQTWEHIL